MIDISPKIYIQIPGVESLIETFLFQNSYSSFLVGSKSFHWTQRLFPLHFNPIRFPDGKSFSVFEMAHLLKESAI